MSYYKPGDIMKDHIDGALFLVLGRGKDHDCEAIEDLPSGEIWIVQLTSSKEEDFEHVCKGRIFTVDIEDNNYELVTNLYNMMEKIDD